MKKNIKTYAWLLVLSIANGCGLLGSDDEFLCDKNAPFKQGDKDICATAIVESYEQNNDTPDEQIKIRLVYGTGSFDFTLTTSEIIISNEYSYPGEVNLWFAAINKSGTGNLTITQLDRTTRTISGQYDLMAEGASNFQAYEFHVVGTFTNITF